MNKQYYLLTIAICTLSSCLPMQQVAADTLNLLVMGDNGIHRPEARFQELAPSLEKKGIRLKYTDDMRELNSETLSQFDGLILYANIDTIEDDQASALLDYVASGGAFIPIHCATYCWRNNSDMVALMGAQFLKHGARVFTTQRAHNSHPIMQGYGGFRSWDETYIHHRHNEEDRTVLEYRVEGNQAAGKDREPWTWIRTHGDGRVFYTAWGHDERTWTHPGFHNLMERGIRWTCGDDPLRAGNYSEPGTFSPLQMTVPRTDMADFEYIDVGPKIPNYTPGSKWGVQGTPRNMMQKPLSPEESLKHYVTPKGMSVRLYADERDFGAKPIAMTWDERGRLWVCETVDYPNELGQNRDRIRICEDTDGDHVADRFTVFADGLSIPTAIVIFRGGAVVQNGTETVFLKDIDGDDKADEQTTLITNWALGDTHGGVSNFRYGLDNWIWAMQGYNNSTPHVDGRPTQTFRMGFWRFKLSSTDPPQVTHLEFIRSSNNNTWGLGISEDGLIFGSTANHNPSMFVPIPNRYYESVRGWSPPTLGSIADTYRFKPITDNVRQVDQFGGYTAGAGHALYTARTFPSQYWNKTAFVCGPTGHLVGTFVLRPDGSNFTSTSPINLLASDDEWSAPIMAEVGPDGAVWVIDWYNYIIQHNPTPQGFETGRGNAYVSELRDRKHGRIYRVVPTNTEAGHAVKVGPRQSTRSRGSLRSALPTSDIVHEYTSLADSTNEQLVETLKHPSFMWRLTAQRLLIERDAGQISEVLEPLLQLVQDQSVDEAGLNVGAIHALHTLKALGYGTLDRRTLSASVIQHPLDKALSHPSAAVRRNALVFLSNDPSQNVTDAHTHNGLMLVLKHPELFKDADAQVRLQAFLTLADLASDHDSAIEPILESIDTVTDPVLLDAITAAASVHATRQLSRLTANESTSSLRVARRVAEHIGRGGPSAEELTAVVDDLKLARAGSRNVILDGLIDGLSTDLQFRTSDAFDATLIDAFQQADRSSKTRLVRLAAKCGTQALDAHAAEVVDAMLQVISSTDADDNFRIASARDLVEFRSHDGAVVASILYELNAQTSPELGNGLLQAIQMSQFTKAGVLIVEVIPTLTPQLKSAAINTLLSRRNWTKSLLAGIEDRAIELSDLSLDQKQSLRSFPDDTIRQQAQMLLSETGGLPDADRDRVLGSLLPLTKQEGNVGAGQDLFKKYCSKCHRHGQTGKAIGPDLTGMAVHPKEELLTHIIDPSRSVEGNFRIYTVVRTDGRVTSGMMAAETRTSITLIDVEAKEWNIQRTDVEELIASRKSLMPDGFEKQMNESELSDLLEFLTNKERYIPISLDRYATAISTRGLFHEGDTGPDRMVFPDWTPKVFNKIPFVLTNPRGKTTPNIILLHGPRGTLPPRMPGSVSLPCNTTAKNIHLLSGVGGWSYPSHKESSVSMLARLRYNDGSYEDHELINGVHFADYIRRVEVPESEFAYNLNGQQIRYLRITPKRSDIIHTIELIKGNDPTAPIVMAVTIER